MRIQTSLLKSFLFILTTLFTFGSSNAQVKATTADVNAGTDDTKFITPFALQGAKYLDQNGTRISAVASGAANIYTATIEPAITSYSTGQLFYIRISTGNTGAATLNLNGLGAKALVKDVATALTSGDLLANKVYAMYYDGANFQVLNAVSGTVQPLINVANNKLLGRFMVGAGVPQDVSVGAGLTLTPSGTLYAGAESSNDGSYTKVIKVSNPTGGQFKGVATETGAIKIELPTNKAIMFAIKGTIYSYDSGSSSNRSSSFLITCYGSAMNNGYSATFSGNNTPNYTVRWYTDGVIPSIYIGELTNGWVYPTVTIDEVQASFSGATLPAVAEGWKISMATEFAGTLNRTQQNTLPLTNFNQPLTGLALVNSPVVATDNMLGAFGKVQGQLNATYSPANFRSAYGGETTGATDANTFLNGHTASYYTSSWLANGYFTGTAAYGGLISFPKNTGNFGVLQLNYSWGHGTTTGGGIAFRTQKGDGTFTTWKELWHSGNLNNLSQLTTRNFSDLQNKPTTLSGFGITDGATQASVTTMDANVVHKTGNESIAGTKLFSTSVGIGTANTLSYKLAVGGGILAESVKVKPQSGWADYVFEKDYPMLPLKELERFILEKKHLPGIPTAHEVKKDGVDLGEINTKLLQKIEELTLYLIEKDKQIKILQDRDGEVKKLSEMVEKLNVEVRQLKNK